LVRGLERGLGLLPVRCPLLVRFHGVECLIELVLERRELRIGDVGGRLQIGWMRRFGAGGVDFGEPGRKRPAKCSGAGCEALAWFGRGRLLFHPSENVADFILQIIVKLSPLRPRLEALLLLLIRLHEDQPHDSIDSAAVQRTG